MSMNKQWLLDSRPTAKVSAANFKLVERPMPKPSEGQALVRHLYLSLDPYMRGRLSEGPSYAKPQEIGAVMQGGAVGQVVESLSPAFKVGDLVVGSGGWQTHSICDASSARVVDASKVPVQAFLGPVGMPGVTAWVGVEKILAPKASETLVVSAATGAVGSVVGQLAKARGARVVGIAGGPEKCGYAVSELGFDACVDHKSPTFAEALKAAVPRGIDALFENVGGACFDNCLRRTNDFARIAVCGLIASYEGAATSAIPDARIILVKRLKIEGFIVSDHLAEWPKALTALAAAVASGKLRYRETVREGLEAAPQGLVDLLHGANFGKMLIKVG